MPNLRGNKRRHPLEKIQERTNDLTSSDDVDLFLSDLQQRIQNTMLNDADDPKKVNLADYLKLITLIEERRRTRGPAQREIIVRWEEPSDQNNPCS